MFFEFRLIIRWLSQFPKRNWENQQINSKDCMSKNLSPLGYYNIYLILSIYPCSENKLSYIGIKLQPEKTI